MSLKTKRLLIDISLKVLAGFVIFLIFLPILVMLPSMFKLRNEIFSSPGNPWTLFPKTPTFDNFSRLLYLKYLELMGLYHLILHHMLYIFYHIQ